MNLALLTLVAALSGFADSEKTSARVERGSMFSVPLADVSGEGPVGDWISAPHLTARRTGRFIVRGQNATDPTSTDPNAADPGAYDSAPKSQSSSQSQTFVQGIDPNTGALMNPGQYPMSPTIDPFYGDPYGLQGIPTGLEYYDPYSRDFQYGYNGYQPYRLDGVLSNFEVGYIGAESVTGSAATGKVSVMEVNTQWRLSSYLPSGCIFSWKPEFNYRGYDGPDGIGLPGHAYRFASDIEFGAQGPGPWGYQIGFTPQITSDFDQNLTSNAYLWDGRGMLFFRPDPTLMLVGGVAFWDRVKDQFVPHAGLVWNPDDQWEFRLMYPKSRISVLLGDMGHGPVWLYATAEYTAEAYEIGIQDLHTKDQVELRDYRAMLGLRSDDPSNVSMFIEGGWVFGRKVDYAGSTPDFSIGDSWLIRAGIRF